MKIYFISNNVQNYHLKAREMMIQALGWYDDDIDDFVDVKTSQVYKMYVPIHSVMPRLMLAHRGLGFPQSQQ